MTRRNEEIGYVAVSLAAAVGLTWPLVTVIGTRIGGDPGDPYQTLWGMRWIHDAVLSFQNPFFTRRLYYPHGVTLVFQTFDIPSALLVLPLWSFLPEVAIYNVAVLAAFALSVYGMARLARELTGDPLSAILAGILFAAVPYHFAHLQGHLHLLSMGWIPLYLVHLIRMVEDRASRWDPVLGGILLGLGSLASWYNLAFALVVTPVVAIAGAVRSPRHLLSRRFARAALVLGATFLVIAGPLLAAMLTIAAREDVAGSHDPVTFSADLYAFAFPNAAQRAAGAFGGHFRRWTGNTTENAAYVGVVVLMLALAGAARHGIARTFVVIAVIGAALSLGPFLHVDGRVLDVRMPYAHVERLLPFLELAGVPVRFGYVMYLGLVTAAAFGLADLRGTHGNRRRGVGTVAALALFAAAMIEYRPRALITWDYPVPAPMRAWARDPTEFAVIDAWDYYRPMWHATIHRKPMVGGYLSRVPASVQDRLRRTPILRSLMFANEEWEVRRIEPAIDARWSAGDAPMGPGNFSAEWAATLLAPSDGRYALRVTANAGSALILDDVPVVRVGACAGASCAAEYALDLAAGRHALKLLAPHLRDQGEVRLEWRPPGSTWEIVPSSALRTMDDRPGLSVTYRQHIPPACGVERATGLAALRALTVRYVITHFPSACVERELALPLIYDGDGVRIYEVPPQ